MAANSTEFTDPYLRSIGEPDKRLDLTDAKVTGLRLRVATSGRRTFYYRYKSSIDAKIKELTIGIYDPENRRKHTPLADARARAEQFNHQRRAGVDPWTAQRMTKLAQQEELDQEEQKLVERIEAKTLGDAWEEYKRHRLPTLKSRKNVISIWRLFFEEWNDIRLENLTRRAIRGRVKNIREGTGFRDRFKPALYQANRAHDVIRSVLSLAVEEEWLEENPAKFEKLKGETKRDKMPNMAQVGAIWCAAADQSPVACRALRMSILTGKRRGELRQLHSDKVDFHERVFVIPAEHAKRGETEIVPMTDQSEEILRAALRHPLRQDRMRRGWVFPGRDPEQPIYEDTLSKWFTDVCKAAKVDGVSLHGLRKTVGTWLNRHNFSEAVIADVLGHTNRAGGAATQHYIDAGAEDDFDDDEDAVGLSDWKRKALERWNAAVLRSVARHLGEEEPTGQADKVVDLRSRA